MNGWAYTVEIDSKTYTFKNMGSKENLLSTLDKGSPTNGTWRRLTSAEILELEEEFEEIWDNY